MCGRFNVIEDPALQQLLQALGVDLGLPRPNGSTVSSPGGGGLHAINVAPTDSIAAVRETALGRECAQMRWWFTPSWAPRLDQKYAMFNARSESVASSRAFGDAFRRRRCLVPMSSFIEWRSEQGQRQPYLIEPVEGAFAVAGIWERWERGETPLQSCAILTTAAAPSFEPLHARMPVIVSSADASRWLDPGAEIAANDPVFVANLQTGLKVTPLSRKVNNARHRDLNVLEAAGEAVFLY